MYDELMPYWKRRCMAIESNVFAREEVILTNFLNSKGIYHPLSSVPKAVPQKGTYEWLDGSSGHSDLLVCGVMLFTYEQGVEE